MASMSGLEPRENSGEDEIVTTTTSFIVSSVKRQRPSRLKNARAMKVSRATIESDSYTVSSVKCISSVFLVWAVLVLPPFVVTLVLLNDPVLTDEDEVDNSTAIISESSSTTSMNNNSDSCYEFTGDFEDVIADFRFWMKGIALSVIGLFGLIGNVLTIVVLSGNSRESNRGFHQMLIALASVDSVVIVYNVMEKSIVETFCPEEPLWYRMTYPFFFHPMNGIIESMSIFLVVAISAERYRAICRPLSKLRISPLKHISFVVFLCVTLEFPRWFEFRIIQLGEGKNATYAYWTSDLMENPSYIRFTSYWDELIVTGFVPIAGLIFFNLGIASKIRSSANFEDRYGGKRTKGSVTFPRKSLSSKPSLADQRAAESELTWMESSKVALPLPETSARKTSSTSITTTSQENTFVKFTQQQQQQPEAKVVTLKKKRERSTIILVSIVVIFFTCHSYRLALKIYEFAFPSNLTEDRMLYCHSRGQYSVPVAYLMLLATSDLALVLNSSVNFVIYCCVGNEFRMAVRKTIMRCQCRCKSIK